MLLEFVINMNKLFRAVSLLAASTVLMGSIGCSDGQFADLGQVTGRVTMDGKPLPGVAVNFLPETGRPAMGRTDDQGEYELVYIRDVRGAEAGEYQVQIVTPFEPKTIEESHQKRMEPIPARYNKRTTLTATVDQGDNTINFELTSAKR